MCSQTASVMLYEAIALLRLVLEECDRICAEYLVRSKAFFGSINSNIN